MMGSYESSLLIPNKSKNLALVGGVNLSISVLAKPFEVSQILAKDKSDLGQSKCRYGLGPNIWELVLKKTGGGFRLR